MLSQHEYQTQKITQRKGSANNTLKLFFHRVSLCLAASVAIACQAQAPSVTNPAPSVSSSVATTPAGIQPAASPNVEATSENVYTNERFGFRFGYPDGFVLEDVAQTAEGSDLPLNTIDLWTAEHQRAVKAGEYSGSEFPANVNVTVHPNPKKLSVRQWIAGNERFVSPQNITSQELAGQEAIAFQSTGLYEHENIVVLTPDGKNIVLISLAQGEEEYRTAFQQIVSTFRFTNSNS